MIDVKAAVKIAFDYLAKLYDLKRFQDVQLEEVELSDDERNWLVTIGFSRPLPLEAFQKSPAKFLLGEDQYKRDYKIITIDSESGKVRSMKIRAL